MKDIPRTTFAQGSAAVNAVKKMLDSSTTGDAQHQPAEGPTPPSGEPPSDRNAVRQLMRRQLERNNYRAMVELFTGVSTETHTEDVNVQVPFAMFEEAQQRATSLKERVTQLEFEQRQLYEKIQQGATDLSTSRSNLDRANENIARLNGITTSLRSELEKRQYDLYDEMSRKEAVEKQYVDKLREMEVLEVKVADATRALEAYDVEISGVRAQLLEESSKRASLQRMIEDKNRNMKEAQLQHQEALEMKIDAMVTQHSEEVTQLTTGYEDKLATKQVAVDDLTANVAELQRRIDQLEKNLSDAKSESAATTRTLQATIKAREEQVQALEKNLTHATTISSKKGNQSELLVVELRITKKRVRAMQARLEMYALQACDFDAVTRQVTAPVRKRFVSSEVQTDGVSLSTPLEPSLTASNHEALVNFDPSVVNNSNNPATTSSVTSTSLDVKPRRTTAAPGRKVNSRLSDSASRPGTNNASRGHRHVHMEFPFCDVGVNTDITTSEYVTNVLGEGVNAGADVVIEKLAAHLHTFHEGAVRLCEEVRQVLRLPVTIPNPTFFEKQTKPTLMQIADLLLFDDNLMSIMATAAKARSVAAKREVQLKITSLRKSVEKKYLTVEELENKPLLEMTAEERELVRNARREKKLADIRAQRKDFVVFSQTADVPPNGHIEAPDQITSPMSHSQHLALTLARSRGASPTTPTSHHGQQPVRGHHSRSPLTAPEGAHSHWHSSQQQQHHQSVASQRHSPAPLSSNAIQSHLDDITAASHVADQKHYHNPSGGGKVPQRPRGMYVTNSDQAEDPRSVMKRRNEPTPSYNNNGVPKLPHIRHGFGARRY